MTHNGINALFAFATPARSGESEMRIIQPKLLAALSVVTLAACGGGASGLEENGAVRVARSLPVPDSSTAVIDFSNYRIGPLDEIAVSVFGAPELNREGTVDAAGNFSMPLVGTVAAGGKTPQQLADDITVKLAGRYLKRPQVTVNIKEARSQTFTVDGAVRQPGVYPIVGRMTLQQAIATARGADEIANLNSVVVFRTVNNQKMAALFSLKDIRTGRMPDPDIYGSDIVVVGENATRRFFKDLTSAFPSLGIFTPVL